MRVLLDTNIVIHREATTAVNEDIGILFKWLDNLHYTKCVHPITITEIENHKDEKIKKTFKVKLSNYNVLKTTAPLADLLLTVIQPQDRTINDINDTLIINELYCGRVDILITEDKMLIQKASLLGIPEKVFTIDAFLEKVNTENPELADYKVLSVHKASFGELDLKDEFFTSFKEDYLGYEKWFNKKADETAYVCLAEDKLIALLYLKIENKGEDYSDINPQLSPKKRLKIGTFKVTLNGYRLGERFIKIIFDNALLYKVEEIYVTIFNKRIEQQRLISLLEEYGFYYHGLKHSIGGEELVYVRSCERLANRSNPKLTYPFFSKAGNIFLVPIYPEYHTELFPDSILRTESPLEYVENEPHRNAISKVYISRSIEKNINAGDILLFYRTGGLYKSVITTIGIAEKIYDNIPTVKDFIELCRQRSVFTDKQLIEQWQYNKKIKPFIVNFLYVYSLPKRINLHRLIELGIIKDIEDAPRGFKPVSLDHLKLILRECQVNEGIIVD